MQLEEVEIILKVHRLMFFRQATGNREEIEENIRNLLESFFFNVLDPEYLNQSLPFETKIRTILAQKQYKVFDALFYWED